MTRVTISEGAKTIAALQAELENLQRDSCAITIKQHQLHAQYMEEMKGFSQAQLVILEKMAAVHNTMSEVIHRAK